MRSPVNWYLTIYTPQLVCMYHKQTNDSLSVSSCG